MFGKPAFKPAPIVWWKVIKTREHGGTIQGFRREVGDTFPATESAMAFDQLEGLVEQTEAPAPAAPATQG